MTSTLNSTLNSTQTPRLGPTRQRGLTSSTGQRASRALIRALDRVGLSPAFVRALHSTHRWWAPTARTRAFAGYTPTERDVLVCTYAKSGTNWMLQVVHQIATRGAGEFDHIHDVAPWPDAIIPIGASLHDDGRQRAPTGMRAIKTHLNAPDVPYSSSARYVVVLRDPKDALASGYHFFHSVLGCTIDHTMAPREWVRLCVSDRLMFGSWAEHVASWWPLRARANVLVLTFDSLRRDLPGAVDRVAALMGVALTPDERAEVITRSGFAWMKRHDLAFAPPIQPLPGRAPPVMVRRGRAGGSSDLFTPEDHARLDDFFAAELRRLGSDFPYARLLAKQPLDERS